jgi:bacillithiol system protein YtxJ
MQLAEETMADIEVLKSLQDWETIWNAEKNSEAKALLVFKRSPICPTSHFVESNFNRYIAKLPASTTLRVMSVDVIGARPVAQRIAADTGVRHESPQALLIGNGQTVLWHASHGDVNEETLDAALAKLK